MTESFAELFEASQANLAKLKPGAIVVGTVVDVRGDVVVINAGLKSEGIVPIEQFRNDAGEIDVGVGDQVKVALDSLENGFGETVLSREKAKRAMVWDELEEALEKNETITGRISGKVKGGFTVDIKDVRAFLPGSLVDVRPVRDPGYLEGKDGGGFPVSSTDCNVVQQNSPAGNVFRRFIHHNTHGHGHSARPTTGGSARAATGVRSASSTEIFFNDRIICRTV